MSITGTYDVFFNGAPAGSLTVSRQHLMTVFEFHSDTPFEVSRLICTCGTGAASIGIPAPDGSGMHLKRSFSDSALASKGISGIDRCLIVPLDANISDYAAKEAPASEDASPSEAAVNFEGPPAGASIPRPEVQDTGPEPEEAPDISPEPEQSADVSPEPEEAPDAGPEPEEAPECAGSAQSWQTVPEPPVQSEQAAPEPVVPAEPVVPERIPADIPGWYYEPEPARLFSDDTLKTACSGIIGAMVCMDGGTTLLAIPYSPSEPFPLLPVFRSGSAVTLGGRNFITYKLEDGVII